MSNPFTNMLCSYHVDMNAAIEDRKMFKYVMHKNGIKKVIVNKIGVFAIEVDDVPGLEEIEDSVELRVPKIPFAFFTSTITFFKKVMAQKNGAEAFVQYFYNPATSEYIIYCPEQTVSGGSVKYVKNEQMEKDFVLVAEIHSHNSMSAFFSGVDNADEKRNMIFGVVGKLHTPVFEYKMRAGISGEYIPLTLFDLFIADSNTESGFPLSWEGKCVNVEDNKTTASAATKYYVDVPGKFPSDAEDYYDEYDWMYAGNKRWDDKLQKFVTRKAISDDDAWLAEYENRHNLAKYASSYQTNVPVVVDNTFTGVAEEVEDLELDVDPDTGLYLLPEGFSLSSLHPLSRADIIEELLNLYLPEVAACAVELGVEDDFTKAAINYTIENTYKIDNEVLKVGI